jgi:hypothetical protein
VGLCKKIKNRGELWVAENTESKPVSFFSRRSFMFDAIKGRQKKCRKRRGEGKVIN